MDYDYIFAHLTIILTLAATSGIFIGKLKQPIMIGYIIAGVLIGPGCFGLVASQEQVHFYSELGILLLLFVIGMELNIKSFLKMWKIPTLFTVIQVVGSAILALLLSKVFGLSVYVSLLTAFFTCLSSTAAIVKVLEYLGELKTDVGHIVIGILVAQDIAVVPMMLIIKECGKPLGLSIVLELAFAVGLVVFMLRYLGKKEQITIPTNHLIPNQELVPVVTLASVFIAASLVTLCGLSEAYGAFLAGLFIGNTQARQNVLNSIKPIQNVLLMIFFLSVGLMFDLRFLFQNWFIVLISLILVTTWKIFFNSVVLKVLKIDLAKATSIGIILAQLGEFSLVLATVATQSGIIGVYGQKLIICITALSLSLSSLFIILSKKVRNLSFTDDNSAGSIIRVIFSGRFSRLVKVIIHSSKNTIKNKIEKIKLSRMQEKELVTVNNNVTSKQININTQANNIESANNSIDIQIPNNNINIQSSVENNNIKVEPDLSDNTDIELNNMFKENNDKNHQQLTVIEDNNAIVNDKYIKDSEEKIIIDSSNSKILSSDNDANIDTDSFEMNNKVENQNIPNDDINNSNDNINISNNNISNDNQNEYLESNKKQINGNNVENNDNVEMNNINSELSNDNDTNKNQGMQDEGFLDNKTNKKSKKIRKLFKKKDSK